MEDFDGTRAPGETSFSSKVFWIQVHNMPFVSMTNEIGRQVASGAGKVMEVDTDGSGNA